MSHNLRRSSCGLSGRALAQGFRLLRVLRVLYRTVKDVARQYGEVAVLNLARLFYSLSLTASVVSLVTKETVSYSGFGQGLRVVRITVSYS